MDGTIGPRRRIFSQRRRRGASRGAVAAGTVLLLLALGLPAAFGQDRVAVRIGNHEGYDRAVFDWSKSIDYDVQINERHVRVAFDQAAELDLAPMLRKFGEAAGDLKSSTENGSAIVSFTLPPRVQLRHFRNGKSIVLDFVRVGSRAPAVDPASTRQLAQEKSGKPQREAAAPALVVPPPPPTTGPAQPAAAQAAAPPPPGEQQSAAPSPPAAAAPRGTAPVALTPVDPVPAAAEPATPGPVAAAPAPASAGPAGRPSAPPAAATETGERSAAPPLTIGPLPARAAGADPMVVEVAPSAVGYRLRFPSKEPLPLATFTRDGVVWIVLERRLALDLAQLQARQRELGQSDTAMVETPVAATVLRLAPPMRAHVGVLRDGESWVVEIGPRPAVALRPSEPLVRGNSDGSGGRVVVEMAGLRNVLRLKDPETNDELIVVPTTFHGAAVAVSRPYPEFRLLPAAQGIVIQPLSDRVLARLVGDALEIAGEQPLVVPGTVQVDAAAATSRQKLMDLAAWRRDGTAFDEQKQSLHRGVAQAQPQLRGGERLALAQFLVAHGLAVEALAQLRALETEAPRLAATPAVRVLRGAAAVLADDIEDAERSLAQSSLALSNEAALWRGIVKLRQDDGAAASELTLRGFEFAERYPPPVGPKVAIAAAQAQLAGGQNDAAARFLDLAQRQPLSEPDRRQLVLLRGRILARQGDTSGALAAWLPLEAGGPSPSRAEAILSRIELMIAAKQMDKGQAIDALDRLRLTWRGDRIELRTLIALARLHSENANPRAGLLVLREAAVQFPTAREAREIANEMELLFAKLYLDGEADKLPPVQAIALFEEFRDLVPTGARGDAMVRRLADRLVQVDLMERAATLLDHQVKHRSVGAERAELGARLALIRLLDGKAEAALAALVVSDDPAAADRIQMERRRIEARALADLGRNPEALARLAGDDSHDADRLRVEIMRQSRDWRGVAEVLGRGVGEPPSAGDKITDETALTVLHQATALALAGDDAGLQQLRQQFGVAMEASPYGALFHVIADGIGGRAADVAAIAQQVGAVAPYQSFLQAYRDKMATSADKGS